MSKATIYHNPRCSKSRATLALLEEQHDDISIVKYLESPPSTETLSQIIEMLNVDVREILRKGESEYKENDFANTDLSNDELISMIHDFPKVLERPIVVYNKKAIIGRPPENVLELFK